MTSRSGGERDSLFGLPLSGNLLASKVAQIDDVIQYAPLVGSNAWKSEIRISVQRHARPRKSTMIPHFDDSESLLDIRRDRKCFLSRDESQGGILGTTRMIHV